MHRKHRRKSKDSKTNTEETSVFTCNITGNLPEKQISKLERQNKGISLFKLKVKGKERKMTGEDCSFTSLKIKRKERHKIVEGVTFSEGKEKIYETWIQSLVRYVFKALKNSN